MTAGHRAADGGHASPPAVVALDVRAASTRILTSGAANTGPPRHACRGAGTQAVNVAVDADSPADGVLAEGQRHAPKTPQRRAAGALYAALIETSTIDGARRALAGFAAEQVQADALELLHRLAAGLGSASTETSLPTGGAAQKGTA